MTLSIEAGEFFTLLGPSGCGKTTLLRLIAGFDAPDAGSIWLDGKDLANKPPEQRPVHTVFQSYALFPHMSVARNVAFPLQMAKKPPEEIQAKVKQALALKCTWRTKAAAFRTSSPAARSSAWRWRAPW